MTEGPHGSQYWSAGPPAPDNCEYNNEEAFFAIACTSSTEARIMARVNEIGTPLSTLSANAIASTNGRNSSQNRSSRFMRTGIDPHPPAR